jgi:hypothetical protein
MHFLFFHIFQLLDKLESKMEGTTMEGIIPSLFQGQYVVNSSSSLE